MTERLADMETRIAGARQLGAVMNAMRGMAAARARQGRNQQAAVDGYAANIAAAIASATALIGGRDTDADYVPTKPAVVLFCAEQGFAGAFSERVLTAAAASLENPEVFVIGSRGMPIAAARGVRARWTSAMPSHSSGISKLADGIAAALSQRVAAGAVDCIEALFSRWEPGHGVLVERRRLFPLDAASLRVLLPPRSTLPLVNLAPASLLAGLSDEHLHAQLCQVELTAFVAENEARMEAMAAAHTELDRQLSQMQAMQRQLRQGEITAEIIELAAGESASRR